MTLQNSFAANQMPTMHQFMPTFPPVPQPADAEKALKMWQWFNGSGLTVEQLDALASLKKSGKDIDKLLGIKPKVDDVSALRGEIAQLREIVSQLAGTLKKDVPNPAK